MKSRSFVSSWSLIFFIPFCALLLFSSTSAFALDQIIRPYQSIRSAGMGNVRMTTGLYEENFFNNPARVTANPNSRFTLVELTPVEINTGAIKVGTSLASSGDALSTIINTSGTNLHDRFQLILPGAYRAASGDRKWAFAFGFITSMQVDADLRQSYQINMQAIVDVGPALTIGRKFLRDDALSLGFTTHLIYRAATSPNYSLLDYVRGVPLTLSSLGGDGAMLDFDVGSTYRITKWGDYNLDFAFAVQNILGGNYSNLGVKVLNNVGAPPPQPRSIGTGFSLARPVWGNWRNTVIAVEATDLLNNSNGSIYRLLHVGAESTWRGFSLRAGINQGYLTAGFGIDLRFITLNIATYGEEMSLNAGGLEDRRYTLSVGLHI